VRVIIAGSRELKGTVEVIDVAVAASAYHVSEVVWGGARGIDYLGKQWAELNGVPVKPFLVDPIQWDRDPKGAGKARNIRMAEYAHALIAVWDGRSGGTAHMIHAARARHLLVYVLRWA
jgi:hypothetical protein